MGFPTRRPLVAGSIILGMRPTQIENGAYATPLVESDLLRVTLEGPAGERWLSYAGGSTVGDAISFAIASAPSDTAWRIVGWNSVYGD
jgi:hypothetical protein